MSGKDGAMRFWRMTSLIAFGWYLFLAVLHFSNLRPLWNDEQCVFYSVKQFSSTDFFTRELLAIQVFPRVYLWVIQHFAVAFDYSLLSLRFLPFLAMIGAFFVWAGIARRQVASDRLLTLFFLTWAASTPLVYYASELKQYSMDVLLAGCLVSFVLYQRQLALDSKPGRYWLLLFLLPFLGLFSYTAFLFLIFPFWGLHKEKSGGFLPLIIYTFACVIAVGCSFWFDMRFRAASVVPAHHGYFISFTSPGEFFGTFFEGINNLIGRWFASRPGWVRVFCRFFMIFGLVEIFIGLREFFRKKEKESLSLHVIGGVVLSELIVLGALKAYPFTEPRTSLFFCPILIVLMAMCFRRIEISSKKWGFLLQGSYAVVTLLFSLAVTRMALWGTVGQDTTPWLRF